MLITLLELVAYKLNVARTHDTLLKCQLSSLSYFSRSEKPPVRKETTTFILVSVPILGQRLSYKKILANQIAQIDTSFEDLF